MPTCKLKKTYYNAIQPLRLCAIEGKDTNKIKTPSMDATP